MTSSHPIHVWRYALLLLRGAAFVLLLWMLAGFEWQPQRWRRPEVGILLDDSRSMSLIDGRSDIPNPANAKDSSRKSRFQHVVDALLAERQGILPQILPHFDVSLVTLSGRSFRFGEAHLAESGQAVRELAPSHDESPLGDHLQGLLQQSAEPPAAIILLSDGHVTDGVELNSVAQQALEEQVPIFAVGIGKSTAPPDLRITGLSADQNVFWGSDVRIELRLTGTNLPASPPPIQVKLQVRGAEPAQMVAPADFAEGIFPPIVFTHHPSQPGQWEYELSVESVPGELELANNQVRHRVSVRDQPLHVLLVASRPSFEYRALKSILGRDPNPPGKSEALSAQEAAPTTVADRSWATGGSPSPLRLTSVLQDADPEYAEIDRHSQQNFPTTLEGLMAFDVVVLCDADPTRLGVMAMQHLKSFVNDGGRGVVMIAGQYFPARYEPAEWLHVLPGSMTHGNEWPTADQTWLPRLTELGKLTPFVQSGVDAEKMWSGLGPIYSVTQPRSWGTGTRILVEATASANPHAAEPLIALATLGSGRILFHMTDETWRWKLSGTDEPFSRYWTQALQYLGQSSLSQSASDELELDRIRYQEGDAVEIRAFVPHWPSRDRHSDPLLVLVESDKSFEQRAILARHATEAHVFTGSMRGIPPGTYRATIAGWPAGPTTEFAVVPRDRELERPIQDEPALRQLAETTRGKYYAVESAYQVAKDLPRPAAKRARWAEPIPLWNRWPVPLLLIGFLSLEWFLRWYHSVE